MLRFFVGLFFVLHGLVHLLYFGHSRRLFELQSGLTWPDGSWAFSRLLGGDVARWVAAIGCLVAAVGFVAGGAALFARQAWWRPLAVAAAAFSAALFLLFWDGELERLADKGAFALLINAAILVALLLLGWPDFGL